MGSIAHTGTLCLAAVARSRDYRGVGIDVEEVQVLPTNVVDLVLTEGERSSVEPGDELILFSAKEAVFKLWWPLAHSWLDFADVSVVVSKRTGTFLAEISSQDAESGFTLDGRFSVTAGLVLAAVALPR